ncbi:unnamed protein product, partial [Hapterophycus canaliculatus]
QVYKAKNKVTNGIVALKKIRVHSENFGVREGLRSFHMHAAPIRTCKIEGNTSRTRYFVLNPPCSCLLLPCLLCQLPVTAIREMKILNELSHDSMVRLLEIVTSVG